MIEIWTVGGGAYVVRGLNAVAAWTSGGGYIAFLEVVTILGFIYALLLTVMDLNWKALINWFLGSTLIYGALMVPTTTVKVNDTTNPSFGAAVVDNVPIGLALFAGLTSQISHWLTTQAEVVFSSPSSQNYSDNGMIYGARLLDQVQALDIDDPVYGENLDNYIKKCVLYDLYLGRKSLDTLVGSKDTWADMASPSVSLFVPYKVESAGVVTTDYKNCVQAYAALNADWTNYFNSTKRGKLWRSMYPELSESLARTKLMSDLPAVYGVLTTSSQGAEKIIQQHMMMNAFMAARAGSNGSEAAASIDSFAQARADIQTSNTYNTIASGARKWVPILNMILTVVFYCLFPVLFPLFLLPQTGVSTLKGYVVGFFYLAAWGPLYVILNMFLVTRYGQGMEAMAGDGGISLSSKDGIQSLNNSVSELSGYLLAMVPFLAAGIARGALAIGNQSHSFLQPQQRAAEAAAADMTLGNHSLGNVSWQNLQANNASTFQQQLAPSLVTGSAMLATRTGSGGVETMYRDRENPVYDSGPGTSRYLYTAAANDNIASKSEQQADALQRQSVGLRAYQGNVNQWSQSLAAVSGTSDTTSRGTQGGRTKYDAGGDETFDGRREGMGSWDRRNENSGHTQTDSGSVAAYADGHVGGDLGPIGGVKVGARAEVSRSNTAQSTQSNDLGSERTGGVEWGSRELKQNGWRNEDGTFYRMSHDQFNSLTSEDRQSYSSSLGQEVSRTDEASKSFRMSAENIRANSADFGYNMTPDMEGYFASNADLSGFRGGGLALLRKPHSEMTSAESAAFDKAMDDYTTKKAGEAAQHFSASRGVIDTQYDGFSATALGGHAAPRGGGVPIAPSTFPGAGVAIGGDRGGAPHSVPDHPVNGRALARELGIGVKAPGVNLARLDPRLDPALREAVSVARVQGLPNPVITSGNDGQHKGGSRHYINEAIDLRGNNITVDQGRLWAQTVQGRLGPGYFVDYETFADEPGRNHLHIQPTGPR